ncbi:hypothetical protein GJ697_02100 [Pseudoduganella sp. FT25W]|uniref:Uncharacterized protein n=2 Tax=Duganella alba TaxID=2666081 RepID=A0A6L5Q9Z1_9BURK|nr:hypothetical protein [Duganella alba]MRX18026.1 hypothetical protein [Duganella alba]
MNLGYERVMENAPTTSGDSQVFAQLRKLGLRPTSARVCVLQVLNEHVHESLPAERIFLLLIEIGISVSLGTIYRVLNELEQRGMVHKEWYALDPAGKSRYVLASAVVAPIACQLLCPSCGRSHSVTDKLFLEALQRQARAGGSDQGLASAVISIPCNQCASAAPTPAAQTPGTAPA